MCFMRNIRLQLSDNFVYILEGGKFPKQGVLLFLHLKEIELVLEANLIQKFFAKFQNVKCLSPEKSLLKHLSLARQNLFDGFK